MKPEELAKIEVSAWLTKYGFNVYWEQKNAHSIPTFKCVGNLGKKPDMLIMKPDGNCCCAIEMKSGEHSKGMRDSHKIIGYYEDVANGKVKYFVDEREVTPHIFLVGSRYSQSGFLTANENLKTIITEFDSNTQGRPQQEYDQTFNFVRMLWQMWNKIRNKDYMLGALLSSKLDGDAEWRPMMFVQKFNERTGRWFAHRFYKMWLW